MKRLYKNPASWLSCFILSALFATLPLGSGCSDSGTGLPGGPDGTDPALPSLFAEGCPVSGTATAGRIDRTDLGMQGPDALGGQGDYLLMNDRAAFIVSRPDNVDSYYDYGGILVDAVALDGCAQAGPEQYEELQLLVGKLDLSNFPASIMRGFRGESIEVLNDGADGAPAAVRVRGTDDYYWLVEYTLMRLALSGGDTRPLSAPLGLEIVVDYVLPPDSPVLRIDIRYRNRLDSPQTVLPAVAHIFGSTTEQGHYSLLPFSVAGFNLKIGVPWITASSPEGSWAFAIKGALTGTANISGVNAVFDLRHGLLPLWVPPEPVEEEAPAVTYFMSVGPGDANSASASLHAVNPEMIPGLFYEQIPVSGTVVELGSSRPVSGAEVEIEIPASEGWEPLHRFRTDDRGTFRGMMASFRARDFTYRLSARREGYPTPEKVTFRAEDASGLRIGFEPGGTLAYNVTDTGGRHLPAKIILWDGDRKARTIHALAAPGEKRVVPGAYGVSVTRGYEYAPYQGEIEIAPDGTSRLDVRLDRVVDTSGFLSMDGHLHAAPSADSKISIADRIAICAAEGLEVPVSTDHEFVGSWQSGIDENGLGEWIATVTGLELTATVPEHVNVLCLEPRFDLNARGGPVPWYGLDIAEVYAAARARGGRVVTLNHPRNGCSYMCLIGYDRLTGRPAMQDPVRLGLRPGAQLWSWDFDAIEYMNGHTRVFVDPARPDSTGLFEDWMSFLNLGHRKTAVATTDTHGIGTPGSPRTYYASSTDEPARMDEDEFAESLLNGRALVSTGAFARVRANGAAGMGDVLTDTDGAVDLWVRIEALAGIDVTHFKVFVNCDEVLSVPASDPHGIVKYDGTLSVPVDRDAHVVVLGFGEDALPRGLDDFDPAGVPRFTTNAIYVDADGNGAYDAPGGKICTYDLNPPPVRSGHEGS
jgi:hypothetical protein